MKKFFLPGRSVAIFRILLLIDNTKDHVESVPDSIYCDLINTLNEKCIQVSQAFIIY